MFGRLRNLCDSEWLWPYTSHTADRTISWRPIPVCLCFATNRITARLLCTYLLHGPIFNRSVTVIFHHHSSPRTIPRHHHFTSPCRRRQGTPSLLTNILDQRRRVSRPLAINTVFIVLYFMFILWVIVVYYIKVPKPAGISVSRYLLYFVLSK